MPCTTRNAISALRFAAVLLLILVTCTTAPPAPALQAPFTPGIPVPPASPGPSRDQASEQAPTPSPTRPLVAACPLLPIVVPTAAPDPGYLNQDMITGLHMTGTPQNLDLASYRLEVTGKVSHPLSLTLDDLRCLPRLAGRPRLICPGIFIDTANWAGASLAAVLALAGPTADARYVELVGADGYSSMPEIERALDPANFLAYEWEGEPIPVLHGFPVRAVMPAEDGNRWVKWLVKIDVR